MSRSSVAVEWRSFWHFHLCFGHSSVSRSYKPNKKFYFPDETDEYETSVEIANMIDEIVSHDEYSDEMLMVDMSLITDDVQLETIYSLDLFRVLAIEMVDDV